MKYRKVIRGSFLKRTNRFVAEIMIDGSVETVHVKNTGRCAELFVPGALVYVTENANPARKTKWDLVAVQKGDTLINIDAMAPNAAVGEWLKRGPLFSHAALIRPEYTYGNSRLDFYVEADGKKHLIEVKGVTLESNGIACFPDAPSDRALKHVQELISAVRDGFEATLLFVVQMKGVRMVTPNVWTMPSFADALKEAKAAGVRLLAYDCRITPDSIRISDPVPVVLTDPVLPKTAAPLLDWYKENKRDLPWRHTSDPYRIWVSEIMLQQTRAATVVPYYERFLDQLPTVKDLADVSEDALLKLWEGLGYYNRSRNMRKAARQIVEDYDGIFPDTYEKIRTLCGIGDYTAGAISSIAFHEPVPAVDGNVLRVAARLTGNEADILKESTKKQIEDEVAGSVPKENPGEYNQALIELGALICLPKEPRCSECPVREDCRAKAEGRTKEIPVRRKAKDRRIEEKTIFRFRDGERMAIDRRGDTGLLAGMYELPNVPGHLNMEEASRYAKSIGLSPIHIRRLPAAKHIFSHVEWHMIGYEIKVDELMKTNQKDFLFIRPQEIRENYPIPTAFEKYMQG